MNFNMRNTPIYVKDPVDALRHEIDQLKGECEVIVLVSHSDWDTDVRVAEALGDDIDMILTGHDHFMRIQLVNGIPILNSGSNFHNLTTTDITLITNSEDTDVKNDNHKGIDYAEDFCESQEPTREVLTYVVQKHTHTLKFKITKHRVKSKEADPKLGVEEDHATKKYALKFQKEQAEWRQLPVARALRNLDPTGVRRGENPVAKGILDIVRKHTFSGGVQAHCAVLHAVGFRGKDVLKKGDVTRGQLKDICQSKVKDKQPTCVIEMTGQMIWNLLQMSLDKLREKGGSDCKSFLQVAGIEYKCGQDRYTLQKMEIRNDRGELVSVRKHDSEFIWHMATTLEFASGVVGYGSALRDARDLSMNDNPSVLDVVLEHFKHATPTGELPEFKCPPIRRTGGRRFIQRLLLLSKRKKPNQVPVAACA